MCLARQRRNLASAPETGTTRLLDRKGRVDMLPYNATDLIRSMQIAHGIPDKIEFPEPKNPSRRWFRRFNPRG